MPERVLRFAVATVAAVAVYRALSGAPSADEWALYGAGAAGLAILYGAAVGVAWLGWRGVRLGWRGLRSLVAARGTAP